MIKKKRSRKLRKDTTEVFIFWFFFGFLTLLLPLVHFNAALDTVLMPRLLALSSFLLVITLFVVLARIRKTGDFGFIRLSVFWVATGFLLITTLTANGALNYKESFFDISKTIVFVVTLFYAFFILQQHKDWPADLARLITVAALIAVSIGFVQYVSRVLPYPDPLLPDRRSVVYLVDGLMAHKNLYASSLMLMLPFLVYGCFKFKGAWKWTVITASVLVVFLIVLLMTRAVWLGLAVGIAFIVLLLIVKGQLIGLSARFRVLMAAGSFLIFVVAFGVLSKMDSGHDFTLVERIKSIVSPRDAHNQPRIKIWNITLEMAKDHPITGVGPGNWKLKMADYLEGFGFLREQINWYRPHNDFLWNLAEKGIFGLLLFLGLFSLTAYYLLYVLFRSKKKDDKIFALCLFAGLMAYVVVSFFDFPYERINHQVYFALMIAAAGIKYIEVKSVNPIKIKIPAVIAFAFILLIFPFIYGVSSTQFEVQVNNAKRAQKFSQWDQMLEISKKIPTTYRDIDPNGLPVLFYTGMAYDQLGDLQNARVAYEKALESHPKNISVMNNLAVIYHKSGQREIAIELLTNALKLAPDYHEGIVNLSSFYGISGDFQKSYDMITRIRPGERTEDIKTRIKFLEGKLKETKN
jgi:O-antigen ligase